MRSLFLSVLIAACAVGASPLLDQRHAHAQESRNFVASLNCGGDGAHSPTLTTAATFWIPRRPDLPAGTQQVWIDLSLFNNNFSRGSFIGTGAFVPEDETQQFDWLNVVPARRHFYRLNALTPGGWVEVGRGEFDTPDCRNVGNFQCQTNGVLRVVFLFTDAPAIANGSVREPLSQWIDLSLFNNFAPGTFIGAGPFPGTFPGPFRTTFEWEGIVPLRVHYYRMNTHYGGPTWAEHPGRRGSFFSLDCRGLPPQPPFHGD